MELIDLVSELLYKHNCVIIPNFGGFVGNFKSTDFDEPRLLISPSRKRVVFNQSLVENDGLLINGLMAQKGIDYAQAEKEVSLFAKFLQDRLAKYKNYEFKNIGSLYLNKEDKLIFVAYDGVNFHKKSYGLQDIKVKRLQHVIVTEKEESKVATRTAKVVPMATETRKRSYYLPQIAASVAILFVFGFVLWQLLEASAKKGIANKGDETEQSLSESTASIIPDLDLLDDSDSQTDASFPEDTIGNISETMEFTDVTEEVTDEKDIVEDIQIPDPVEVNEAPIEEEIVEEIADPIVVEEVTPVQIKEKPRYTPRTENVYYIAVAKNYSDAVESQKRRKLEQHEYSLFELEAEGDKLLCLEKFISEKNAQDYLKLVKRYDDKYAFLFVNQE